MPRPCTICTHSERVAIDEALVSGTPYRNIAERFGTSKAVLSRHKNEHLPEKLTKAKAAEEVAEADDLLSQIRHLQRRTLAILTQAESDQDHRTALKAVAEARRNLDLLAKLTGELEQEGAVTIINNPAYIEVRQTIIEALLPYPEARTAVAEVLAE